MGINPSQTSSQKQQKSTINNNLNKKLKTPEKIKTVQFIVNSQLGKTTIIRSKQNAQSSSSSRNKSMNIDQSARIRQKPLKKESTHRIKIELNSNNKKNEIKKKLYSNSPKKIILKTDLFNKTKNEKSANKKSTSSITTKNGDSRMKQQSMWSSTIKLEQFKKYNLQNLKKRFKSNKKINEKDKYNIHNTSFNQNETSKKKIELRTDKAIRMKKQKSQISDFDSKKQMTEQKKQKRKTKTKIQLLIEQYFLLLKKYSIKPKSIIQNYMIETILKSMKFINQSKISSIDYLTCRALLTDFILFMQKKSQIYSLLLLQFILALFSERIQNYQQLIKDELKKIERDYDEQIYAKLEENEVRSLEKHFKYLFINRNQNKKNSYYNLTKQKSESSKNSSVIKKSKHVQFNIEKNIFFDTEKFQNNSHKNDLNKNKKEIVRNHSQNVLSKYKFPLFEIHKPKKILKQTNNINKTSSSKVKLSRTIQIKNSPFKNVKKELKFEENQTLFKNNKINKINPEQKKLKNSNHNLHQVILDIDVDLGNEIVSIEFKKSDDPKSVAQQFGLKYHLSLTARKNLENLIIDAISKY